MTTEIETTGTEVAQETTEVADTKVEASGEGAATDSTDSTSEADGNVAQPSAPVYTPNYKFKANQQELEFDPVLRAAIKSADQEKKIRELYEKSYGFENVKADREQFKAQYGELQAEHQNLRSGLDQLTMFVQKKDYESFFQALGIPEKDVMQYAVQRLKLQEATPEQRQAYEQQRAESQRLYQLERQNQQLQEQFTQQSVGQRATELNYAMQRPEVAAVMQQFDSRLGQGAFRNEVIRRGQLYHATQGQDISVDQAIAEVISLIGQQQQMDGGTPGVVAQNPMAKKPVIPNIQGRSSVSPAKKVYNSLDAIKQRAKELSQQG